MKYSNDSTGNRARDLPTCTVVPQPTAPTAYQSNQSNNAKFKKVQTQIKNEVIIFILLFSIYNLAGGVLVPFISVHKCATLSHMKAF